MTHMNDEMHKEQLRHRIKGMYFPVLDHGFVALVDYMGGDADVLRAARVSYGAGTKKTSEDRALLRYLMRHAHTTPFEMVELKFHVKLPIFVARQLIRHRTASVNEYSMRYSLAPMQFYNAKYENLGSQSKKNKQGRGEPIDPMVASDYQERVLQLQKSSSDLYELLIQPDIDLARELARMHLPLSLYTEWYWKIDLKNCLDFLKLRVDKHAQWEIQETARVKAGICNIIAPMSFEAWVDYKYQSRTFSRMEIQLLRKLLQTENARMFGTPDAGQILATRTDQELVYNLVGARDAADMSKREWEDLLAVFDPVTSFEPETFELDLSKAKTAQYFADEAAKYVPKVDQK